jgi:hypothetical protein
MGTGPRPLIERLVGALIPPPSREHVLGDLCQRYKSDWQYVLDACRVVPTLFGVTFAAHPVRHYWSPNLTSCFLRLPVPRSQ